MNEQTIHTSGLLRALQEGDLRGAVQRFFEDPRRNTKDLTKARCFFLFFARFWLETIRRFFVRAIFGEHTVGAGRMNPLCEAVNKEQEDVVKFLMNRGMNVNETSATNWTPLCFSIRKGNTDLCLMLLDHGADLNPVGGRVNPLHVAVRSNNLPMVDLLLRKGADPNTRSITKNAETALHQACERGNADMVHLLLNNGAKVCLRDCISRTPLHRCHRVDVAQILLEHRVNVNARDVYGCNCLHLCVSARANLDLIRLLIDAGIDVNSAQKGGSTALHLAVLRGHVEAARLLIENGANLSAKNSLGRTPLHFATSMQNNAAMVQLLLQAGSSRDIQAMRGHSPLHLAVSSKSTKTAETLLNAGADPNVVNSEGRTPLLLLSKFGNEDSDFLLEAFRLLSKHSADLNARGPGGRTLLHDMIQEQSETSLLIARELLERGCELLPDSNGETPLHVACHSGGKGPLVNLCLEKGRGVLDVGNAEGWLPLHFLCWNDAPLDDIYTALRNHPDSTMARYKRC